MAKNTSMTLGGHFDSFISDQIKSGRYGSASEVVRAGLRVLEDKDSKLSILIQMLTDGEESGISDYNRLGNHWVLAYFTDTNIIFSTMHGKCRATGKDLTIEYFDTEEELNARIEELTLIAPSDD